MTLRMLLIPPVLAVAACAAVPETPPAATLELDQQAAAAALPALTQQLLDAVPHDAAVWRHYVSEQAVYVSEAGDVVTKGELLEGFRPFPPGLSGTLRVQEPRVSDFGDVATIVFDALETQTVFDQTIEVRYFGSQTWRREGGRWRLLLAHNAVRAQDPAPLPIVRKRLRDFTGTYELGAWRYEVKLRDGTLVAGRAGAEPQPLIAVGDNVFLAPGDPLAVLRIFVREPDGKVRRMVQRRKFADLVWKKV